MNFNFKVKLKKLLFDKFCKQTKNTLVANIHNEDFFVCKNYQIAH